MEADRFEALTVEFIERVNALAILRERFATNRLDLDSYLRERGPIEQRLARVAQAWIVAGMQEGRVLPGIHKPDEGLSISQTNR